MGLRLSRSIGLAAAGLLICALAAEAASPKKEPEPPALAGQKVSGAPAASFSAFLDRLMRAESDGRDFLTNARSTALGPFQFVEDTFLYVTRRHFADEVAKLTEDEILALRTNRAFSRRAAAAYCKESAAFLGEQGFEPTFADLRLAYLVGPYGAVRVMRAPPKTPVSTLLAPAALRANPFMGGMTAADLIARAARDVSRDGAGRYAPTRRAGKGPQIRVRCNRKLPSCRRWIALHLRKVRVMENKRPDKGHPRKKRHEG